MEVDEMNLLKRNRSFDLNICFKDLLKVESALLKTLYKIIKKQQSDTFGIGNGYGS